MGLSYYDAQSKPRTGLAKAWMILNAGIALGMMFHWSGFAGIVADPFKWAMRDGVGMHPSLFEYPYVLLWSTPAMCVIAGLLAMRVHQHSIARIVGGYPTLMLALMLGWYYLAPSHWL